MLMIPVYVHVVKNHIMLTGLTVAMVQQHACAQHVFFANISCGSHPLSPIINGTPIEATRGSHGPCQMDAEVVIH